MPSPELQAQAPQTYDQLIRDSRLPRLEARALLEHASGRRREWLIAHGDEPVPAEVASAFAGLARRRRDGEPIAYLVGGCEFRGQHFAVSPAVLIPRTDTEVIVDWALELARPAARVIDLGTGSGVIAISLALTRPDLEVWASDVSPAALAVARGNAERLLAATGNAERLLAATGSAGQIPAATGSEPTPITWREGAWWQAVESGERFHLALSNPPYISASDHHLGEGDLRFEPRPALTPGPAGTEAIDELIAGAPEHLASGGWLLLEHGFDQGEAVRSRLAAAGFAAVETRRDTAGHERVSGGRWGDV